MPKTIASFIARSNLSALRRALYALHRLIERHVNPCVRVIQRWDGHTPQHERPVSRESDAGYSRLVACGPRLEHELEAEFLDAIAVGRTNRKSSVESAG